MKDWDSWEADASGFGDATGADCSLQIVGVVDFIGSIHSTGSSPFNDAIILRFVRFSSRLSLRPNSIVSWLTLNSAYARTVSPGARCVRDANCSAIARAVSLVATFREVVFHRRLKAAARGNTWQRTATFPLLDIIGEDQQAATPIAHPNCVFLPERVRRNVADYYRLTLASPVPHEPCFGPIGLPSITLT